MSAFALLAAIALLSIAAGCEKPGGDDNPDTPAAEPPTEVNQSNLFIVDFFSTLDGKGRYFDGRKVSEAVSYIKNISGKKSVAYMFDRMDFVIGEVSPSVEIAYGIGGQPFFAQVSGTSATTEGTGIATLYTISEYDGVALDAKTFMSGCAIPVPLAKSTEIRIYTARLESAADLKAIYGAKSTVLQGDAVIIGSVKSSAKEEIGKYVKTGMGERITFFGSAGTSYDLFAIVPAAFVCRSMEKGGTDGLPGYRVSIEKWDIE